MKKLSLLLGVLALSLVICALCFGIGTPKGDSGFNGKKKVAAQVESHAQPAAEGAEEGAPSVVKPVQPEHVHAKANCKTCHDCEYPTRENPCLAKCPKNVTSVHHSASQAPEVLVLNVLSDKYDGVVFSHKLHAQMSEMGVQGCTGCHHYNTTGPVLNCRKCHETFRKREDVSKVDLEGAYHRQCMPCHRKWSKTTDCDSCHQLKTAQGRPSREETIRKYTGKSHAAVKEPKRLVWETTCDRGRYVTFYHDEHVNRFKLSCNGCHTSETCMTCHEPDTKAARRVERKERWRTPDFQKDHKRCTGCHATSNCTLCHGDKPAGRFSHAVNAGWDLGKNHAQLSCDRCHGKLRPVKKVERRCASCHADWKLGSFDHRVTGLSLSPNHQQVDCESCHPGRDYSRKVCKECHSDRSYPQLLPGTRRAAR